MPHVLRRPLQLVAAGQQFGTQLGIAPTVGDVPLARRDDLERLLALLVEVRHALGRLGFAHQFAVLAQHRHGRLTSREGGLAGDLLVGRLVDDPIRGLAHDAPVASDDRAGRQLQLAPPGDVGQVAEGTAHRDTRALLGLGVRMSQHGHLDTEGRRSDRRPEQRLVALVVGVGDQRTTGGQQFGTSGLDQHLAAVGTMEVQRVVEAVVLPRLELGLGDRGLEGDIPQRRSVRQIGLTARVVVQECPLGDRLCLVRDRAVQRVPVDRQADMAPQILEDLLVDGRQLETQLHEVAAADRDGVLLVGLGGRGEVRIVGQRRLAAHAVEVLDAPFGGQPVVVPAHRVEDVLAAHPLVASDQIGVGVAENVADVQRTGHRGRGSIDRIDLLAGFRPAEGVGALIAPAGGPPVLEALQHWTLRYLPAGGVGG